MSKSALQQCSSAKENSYHAFVVSDVVKLKGRDEERVVREESELRQLGGDRNVGGGVGLVVGVLRRLRRILPRVRNDRNVQLLGKETSSVKDADEPGQE